MNVYHYLRPVQNDRAIRSAAIFWGVAVLFPSLILFTAVGCGPSRKEYAINEALLVDQTRVLEDQLYRAHFQIQRLEDENKRLRQRIEAKGEKADPSENKSKSDGKSSDASSGVPFEQVGEMEVPYSYRRPAPYPNQDVRSFQTARTAGSSFLPASGRYPSAAGNYSGYPRTNAASRSAVSSSLAASAGRNAYPVRVAARTDSRRASAVPSATRSATQMTATASPTRNGTGRSLQRVNSSAIRDSGVRTTGQATGTSSSHPATTDPATSETQKTSAAVPRNRDGSSVTAEPLSASYPTVTGGASGR